MRVRECHIQHIRHHRLDRVWYKLRYDVEGGDSTTDAAGNCQFRWCDVQA